MEQHLFLSKIGGAQAGLKDQPGRLLRQKKGTSVWTSPIQGEFYFRLQCLAPSLKHLSTPLHSLTERVAQALTDTHCCRKEPSRTSSFPMPSLSRALNDSRFLEAAFRAGSAARACTIRGILLTTRFRSALENCAPKH